MIKLVVFFLINLISLSSFAIEFEPNDLIPKNTELTIVGKGISPKSNKNIVIFYSCVDFDLQCKKIRAVFYNQSNGTAYWVGPTIDLFQNELNQKFKQINKDFNKYNRIINHRTNAGNSFVGMCLGTVFIPKWLVGLGLVTTGTGLYVAGASFVVGGTIYILSSFNLMFTGSNVTKVFSNQDGWNWSKQVRSVSTEKFWDFFRYIKSGYPRVVKMN